MIRRIFIIKYFNVHYNWPKKGFLEGSEFPDEYIMVGNHRDSWIHGAIDAGAGMITLIETARVFSEMKFRPKVCYYKFPEITIPGESWLCRIQPK